MEAVMRGILSLLPAKENEGSPRTSWLPWRQDSNGWSLPWPTIRTKLRIWINASMDSRAEMRSSIGRCKGSSTRWLNHGRPKGWHADMAKAAKRMKKWAGKNRQAKPPNSKPKDSRDNPWGRDNSCHGSSRRATNTPRESPYGHSGTRPTNFEGQRRGRRQIRWGRMLQAQPKPTQMAQWFSP
ncbi:Dihydrolipoyllysine-residue acetyltransferase component 5 of pyruvate dehydrogenase [Actinidia chinensis var. chinensis]|uniref:Dihydrolipoyllysine-residue acetyltransferase component 5 of pyruvate dehydrogenase n=1 Tax=Actinidia chinensis var. chinensis TaxID=1590841 RepID=A0A2R6RYT9_ACTCC|nr:Dihydrolipoyllysine-residue acetyltransferase component 5 of pyruvate dehydrogenase [Actinidia chinensis var. chinensis]